MQDLVYNNSISPLYVQIQNQSTASPVVVTDVAAVAAQSGTFFAITTNAISVVANGFLDVQLTNPSISGKKINVSRISGGAITNTTIDLIRNGTFTVAGTAITPRNTNTAFTDNSPMTAKYLTQGTDPTIGTVVMNTIIQTGGPLVIDYNGRIIITPNNTLLVRLANQTNQVNIISINISWYESTT